MNKIIATLLLALCSCTRHGDVAPPLLPAFDDGNCPYLPDDLGYSIKGTLGPDYTICTLAPLRPGLLPAEIRVGGHWDLPDSSRFAGFSKTPIGHIAWFYGARKGSGRESMAFLPTGPDNPSGALLVIFGGDPREVTLQREPLLAGVVRAGMRPNNSFKPKPLRGSA